MRRSVNIALLIMVLIGVAYPQAQPQPQPQARPQKGDDDQPIRITTQLIQLDAVVVDKKGQVVKGLKREDFEIVEGGKRQPVEFFEYVEAGKGKGRISISTQAGVPGAPPSAQGASEGDIGRIFAFVVDDLTIRPDDLVYVRRMLSNFVTNQMQATDLVAIVRTVGGKGLLQQFTTDKQLLGRAIESLTPTIHPLNSYTKDNDQRLSGARPPSLAAPDANEQRDLGLSATGGFGDDPLESRVNYGEDTNRMMRSYMSLGTASFVIDSMRQLPGRKSLVLISAGLPILDQQAGTAAGNVSHFINQLTDKATRAGVAIHTLDIQGLSGQVGVARFTDTPGKSMMGGVGDNATVGLGRQPDEAMLGGSAIENQMGLRRLAADTGGIAILNRNNFDEGLGKIIDANEGYYLLAYTPQDPKFDGKFRRVEIKVKGDGLKVYSRRGYFAREEKAPVASTKQDEILTAVRAPLAKLDVEMDAMMLYKAMPPDKGAIDMHLVIDSKKLQFEPAGDKQQASLDIAGFVFDERGEVRGGFSETVNANLSAEEYNRISKGGFTYSANTTLPTGVYQVRFAVRDNKSGRIGTMSRYIEVPDLSKGKFFASSLLLGAVPSNDTKATTPTPVAADRQISRTNDLRYAAVIYNAKQKDGKAQIKTQLMISQGGKVIFKEPEEMLAGASGAQVIKVGQLGLSRVPLGRYTLSLVITDTLADKKSQTVTRSMDFIVTQ